jgi:hypothetical protein
MSQQEAQGPHPSPESYWLIFRIKNMQIYFSLLPLYHFARKFELFLAQWFLEKIFKDFPH